MVGGGGWSAGKISESLASIKQKMVQYLSESFLAGSLTHYLDVLTHNPIGRPLGHLGHLWLITTSSSQAHNPLTHNPLGFPWPSRYAGPHKRSPHILDVTSWAQGVYSTRGIASKSSPSEGYVQDAQWEANLASTA